MSITRQPVTDLQSTAGCESTLAGTAGGSKCTVGVRRKSCGMLPVILLCSGLLVGTAKANADVASDIVLNLKASVSAAVPHITLTWSTPAGIAANITSQKVYRRPKGTVSWGTALATLTVSDVSWADATAVEGVEYEYWVDRKFSGLDSGTPDAFGYLMAGYKLPMTEGRGKMLLVVDDALVGPLALELAQLRRDLTGDGWTVQTIPVSTSLTPITTKAIIKSAYDADPANVTAVYLLGHIAPPFSGKIYVDGHSPGGAHEADGYYGEMNGAWTDTSVNAPIDDPWGFNQSNIPGDGKFDQSQFPSPVKLMVGRVDLTRLPFAPGSGTTELDLMRRYLGKAHDYKFKQRGFASIRSIGSINDLFFNAPNRLVGGSNYAWVYTCAGGVGSPGQGDTFLIAAENGVAGSPNLTSSYTFGSLPFRSIFYSVYCSGASYWNIDNAALRAALAGNDHGDLGGTPDSMVVATISQGRNYWFMHSMASGNPIGYAVRMSMNSQLSAFSNPTYTPHYVPESNQTTINFSLHGDPSLRFPMVEPPRNLQAQSSGGQVQLAWSASTEPTLIGYHVYRAASAEGPFTRLSTSPLISPVYVDASAPAGTCTYMVRTLVLTTSPGGTYQNASVGDLVDVVVRTAMAAVPRRPTSLTVALVGGSAQLTWLDNATDETGYRVERLAGEGGTFNVLATLAAGSTLFLDPNPPAGMNCYRVVAMNAAGDSIPSATIVFRNKAGSISVVVDPTSSNLYKMTDYFPCNRYLTWAVDRTDPRIPVQRSGGSLGAASVHYVSNAGSDIQTAGDLQWADGESGVKYITLPVPSASGPQHPLQALIVLSHAVGADLSTAANQVACCVVDRTATLSAPWQEWSDWSSSRVRDSKTPPVMAADGSISSTTCGNDFTTVSQTTDRMHLLYRSRAGDGIFTCFVAANPGQSGQILGICVRAGVQSTDLAASTLVTPSGSMLLSRSTSAAMSVSTTANPAFVAPCWLRLIRSGNNFTAASSRDGATWTTLGTVTIAGMPLTANWGLMHSSQTVPGEYQVGTFRNITLGPPSANIIATTATASEVSGTLPGVCTVSLSEPVTSTTVVNYTVGGTATANVHYIPLSGSVTIPAGQTSATVTITPIDDNAVDGPLTVVLTLASGTGYSAGAPGNATITIMDKNAQPTVTVAATEALASETPGHPGIFTITLSNPRPSSTIVNVHCTGTASSGTDFTPIGNTVVIPAGKTSATVTLQPIDDTIVEDVEAVTLWVDAGTNYLVGSQSTAAVTIFDNDSAPDGPGTGITHERFDNISGNLISNLTSAATYPSSPTLSMIERIFEIQPQEGDWYGTRMHGYLIAPLTGTYTFYLCADDVGELWLSTDTDPAHAVLIASGSNPYRNWNGLASSPIQLVAGTRYYIRVLQKESGGGDCLCVGVQLPGGAMERPIPWHRLDPWDYASPHTPTITSLNLTSGPTAGGATVTITGTNLIGTSSVSFGGTAATAVTVVNATTVICVTPAKPAGAVDVTLLTSIGSATRTNGYTFVNPPAAPTITLLTPASGTLGGGTTVTITGANLTGTSAVTFGGTAATAVTLVNNTTVTCVTPAKALGTVSVDVVLTAPGGSVVRANGYTYVTPPAPTITSFSPTRGTKYGGTLMTITGSNLTETTSVKFAGGAGGSDLTVVSANLVTCLTPPSANGSVDLTLTTPGGEVTLAYAFTYFDPPAGPSITSFSPASGVNAGGTTVTITGLNLTGTSSVTFGGAAATAVTVVSTTSVTCVTPAQVAGTAAVAVTTPNGTATVAGAFTFIGSPADPAITSLSPTSGAATGGTTVTIAGAKLTGTSSVKFGGNAATSVTVVNDTTVTCVTPANAGGAVYVVLTTAGGTAISANGYFYNPLPVANAQSVTTAENTAKAITLTGSDVDGDTLTYAIVTSPAHGTLTGTAPNFTYTPAVGYMGRDSFTFKVNNGKLDSVTALVTIGVASTDVMMYLPFDETSGTVAADGSGNGKNGTLVNGPAWKAGKVNNALDFNGSNSYVTVADTSSLRLGTQQTLACWVKPDSMPSSWARLIGKGDSTYRNYEMWREVNSGRILYRIYSAGGNSDAYSATPLSTGVWTHVACTYDGLVMKVYLNGQLSGQAAYTQAPYTSANPLTVGGNEGSSFLDGMMDEVRVYNRALSAVEITNLVVTCTVTATAGSGGSISPWGVVTVNCGNNQTFTITTNACYHIGDVQVDGVSLGAVPRYVFTNVTTNHTIVASFAADMTTLGTPCWWLTQYGLASSGNFNVAETDDADHDGMLNWQEYKAGTNPTNAASVLAISAVSIPSDSSKLVLSWPSVTGRTYAIRRCANLVSGLWSTLDSNILAVPPSNIYTDYPLASSNLFYRIIVE